MATILVTGGCGYIGSHTLVDLLEHGHAVRCLDNLSNADEEVLEGIRDITGEKVENSPVDLRDRQAVLDFFRESGDIQGVIHFAALKAVGESVEKPLLYYDNNINGLLHLLEAMDRFAVPHLIFSSSCSVYGNARELPVREETPFEPPESPYAHTKQVGEEIIRQFLNNHSGMQAILLRYFNPAGAHPSAKIGEAPINRASNLVPVITETAIGKREKLQVFGNDYHTRDGSCIRDYIHVMDLARAHTLALEYLQRGRATSAVEVFNLGIGKGVTVLEAIRAFEKSTGQTLPYEIAPRRPGDVEAVYADYSRARQKLGWVPGYGIEEIMRTAWQWEQNRSDS